MRRVPSNRLNNTHAGSCQADASSSCGHSAACPAASRESGRRVKASTGGDRTRTHLSSEASVHSMKANSVSRTKWTRLDNKASMHSTESNTVGQMKRSHQGSEASMHSMKSNAMGRVKQTRQDSAASMHSTDSNTASMRFSQKPVKTNKVVVASMQRRSSMHSRSSMHTLSHTSNAPRLHDLSPALQAPNQASNSTVQFPLNFIDSIPEMSVIARRSSALSALSDAQFLAWLNAQYAASKAAHQRSVASSSGSPLSTTAAATTHRKDTGPGEREHVEGHAGAQFVEGVSRAHETGQGERAHGERLTAAQFVEGVSRAHEVAADHRSNVNSNVHTNTIGMMDIPHGHVCSRARKLLRSCNTPFTATHFVQLLSRVAHLCDSDPSAVRHFTEAWCAHTVQHQLLPSLSLDALLAAGQLVSVHTQMKPYPQQYVNQLTQAHRLHDASNAENARHAMYTNHAAGERREQYVNQSTQARRTLDNASNAEIVYYTNLADDAAGELRENRIHTRQAQLYVQLHGPASDYTNLANYAAGELRENGIHTRQAQLFLDLHGPASGTRSGQGTGPDTTVNNIVRWPVLLDDMGDDDQDCDDMMSSNGYFPVSSQSSRYSGENAVAAWKLHFLAAATEKLQGSCSLKQCVKLVAAVRHLGIPVLEQWASKLVRKVQERLSGATTEEHVHILQAMMHLHGLIPEWKTAGTGQDSTGQASLLLSPTSSTSSSATSSTSSSASSSSTSSSASSSTSSSASSSTSSSASLSTSSSASLSTPSLFSSSSAASSAAAASTSTSTTAPPPQPSTASPSQYPGGQGPAVAILSQGRIQSISKHQEGTSPAVPSTATPSSPPDSQASAAASLTHGHKNIVNNDQEGTCPAVLATETPSPSISSNSQASTAASLSQGPQTGLVAHLIDNQHRREDRQASQVHLNGMANGRQAVECVVAACWKSITTELATLSPPFLSRSLHAGGKLGLQLTQQQKRTAALCISEAVSQLPATDLAHLARSCAKLQLSADCMVSVYQQLVAQADLCDVKLLALALAAAEPFLTKDSTDGSSSNASRTRKGVTASSAGGTSPGDTRMTGSTGNTRSTKITYHAGSAGSAGSTGSAGTSIADGVSTKYISGTSDAGNSIIAGTASTTSTTSTTQQANWSDQHSEQQRGRRFVGSTLMCNRTARPTVALCTLPANPTHRDWDVQLSHVPHVALEANTAGLLTRHLTTQQHNSLPHDTSTAVSPDNDHSMLDAHHGQLPLLFPPDKGSPLSEAISSTERGGAGLNQVTVYSRSPRYTGFAVECEGQGHYEGGGQSPPYVWSVPIGRVRLLLDALLDTPCEDLVHSEVPIVLSTPHFQIAEPNPSPSKLMAWQQEQKEVLHLPMDADVKAGVAQDNGFMHDLFPEPGGESPLQLDHGQHSRKHQPGQSLIGGQLSISGQSSNSGQSLFGSQSSTSRNMPHIQHPEAPSLSSLTQNLAQQLSNRCGTLPADILQQILLPLCKCDHLRPWLQPLASHLASTIQECPCSLLSHRLCIIAHSGCQLPHSFLQDLTKRTEALLDGLSHTEVARILWSVAKLGLNPPKGWCLQLLYHFQHMTPLPPPLSQTPLTHHLTTHSAHVGHQLANSRHASLPQLIDAASSSSSPSISSSPSAPSSSSSYMQHTKHPSLSSAVYRPPDTHDGAQHSMYGFQARDMVLCLWAVDKMKCLPPEPWSRWWTSTLGSILFKANATDCTLALSCLSSIHHTPPRSFLQDMLCRVEQLLPSFSTKDALMLLKSAAAMQLPITPVTWERLLELIQGYYLQKDPDVPTLVMALSSLATVPYHPPGPWMLQYCTAVQGHMHHMGCADLACLAAALSTMDYVPSKKWSAAFMQRLTRLVRDLSSSQVQDVLWFLGRLPQGIQPEPKLVKELAKVLIHNAKVAPTIQWMPSMDARKQASNDYMGSPGMEVAPRFDKTWPQHLGRIDPVDTGNRWTQSAVNIAYEGVRQPSRGMLQSGVIGTKSYSFHDTHPVTKIHEDLGVNRQEEDDFRLQVGLEGDVQQVINLATNLARFKGPACRQILLSTLVIASEPVLTVMNPGELAYVLKVLAGNDHWPAKKWLATFTRASHQQLQRSCSRDLATMLWALGKLSRPLSRTWMAGCLKRLSERAHERTPEDRFQTAWALGRLSEAFCPHQDWLTSFVEDVAINAHSHSPVQLVLILWGMGKLQVAAGKLWIQQVLMVLQPHLNSLCTTTPECSWHPECRLYQDARSVSTSQAPPATPERERDFASTSAPAHRVQGHQNGANRHQRSRATQDPIQQAAQPPQVADVADSADVPASNALSLTPPPHRPLPSAPYCPPGKLAHRHGSLPGEKKLQHLLPSEQDDALQPRHLSMLAHALSQLQFTPDPTFSQVFVHASLSQASRLSPQGLANTLRAMASLQISVTPVWLDCMLMEATNRLGGRAYRQNHMGRSDAPPSPSFQTDALQHTAPLLGLSSRNHVPLMQTSSSLRQSAFQNAGGSKALVTRMREQHPHSANCQQLEHSQDSVRKVTKGLKATGLDTTGGMREQHPNSPNCQQLAQQEHGQNSAQKVTTGLDTTGGTSKAVRMETGMQRETGVVGKGVKKLSKDGMKKKELGMILCALTEMETRPSRKVLDSFLREASRVHGAAEVNKLGRLLSSMY